MKVEPSKSTPEKPEIVSKPTKAMRIEQKNGQIFLRIPSRKINIKFAERSSAFRHIMLETFRDGLNRYMSIDSFDGRQCSVSVAGTDDMKITVFGKWGRVEYQMSKSEQNAFVSASN